MFLSKLTSKSTESYSDKIKKLKKDIDSTDAILIGAGAGMSTSAGLTYSGERFYRFFFRLSQEIRHKRHLFGRILSLRYAAGILGMVEQTYILQPL